MFVKSKYRFNKLDHLANFHFKCSFIIIIFQTCIAIYIEKPILGLSTYFAKVYLFGKHQNASIYYRWNKYTLTKLRQINCVGFAEQNTTFSYRSFYRAGRGLRLLSRGRPRLGQAGAWEGAQLQGQKPTSAQWAMAPFLLTWWGEMSCSREQFRLGAQRSVLNHLPLPDRKSVV